MRNGLKYMFMVCLCMLVAGTASLAQTNWDYVLDRYESITVQCKSLRDKAAAGEVVSQKSVTALFGELGRLRNMLQQSSGKMSKIQRERFDAIRESYEGKKIPRSDLRQAQDGAQNLSGTAKEAAFNEVPVSKVMREHIEPLPKGREILRFAQNDNHASLENDSRAFLRNDSRVILSGANGETKDLSVKRINVIPTVSLGDTRQGGLFLAMTRGRWGGYVSLRTNFVSQFYAYDILSDGTTPGEAVFEAKGGQRIGEYSAAAGVIHTVTPWMELYAGAGYGSSTLCWNDSLGAWAKVNDYSGAGLMLDGGAVFHVGKISLLGGVSWLTTRPEAGPFMPVFSAGVGIGF